ncbi:sigma-70 family RNA polymerase sigma factor [Algoriphagus sp.]|uniref:RNA polymerase sigma factor n=1 Tax=Algoriphagus sp. TaxID=1872435 RepID=UPI002632D32F|nr:sigma-70 family RNA polymerase sigma factor [Algoriphagus sp.]
MKSTLVNLSSEPSTSGLPIEQLYLGCLAQNPRTQRELFNRLYPKMLNLCLKYVKNSAAAEDVLLVAFRKIFDRIEQFKQTGSFEGWIRRIVVNECLMQLEKESQWQKDTGLEKIQLAANQENPDTALHWEDLIKTMELLPAGYRKVFELFVFDGLSHEEIGKELSISQNTSKSQLCRARVLLQRLLQMEPRNN